MILKPLGHQQITDVSAATSLTVPAGAQRALLCPQTQAVRFRDDGTDPTATVGIHIGAGERFLYEGNLSTIKLIQEAAGAKLDISYYA